MGKKDAVLGQYFEDNDRFADLINAYVFGGKQVVAGEDVKEKDSRVLGILGRVWERFIVQKYRDAVRRIVLGMDFVVIGLEHQDIVHYAMPARIMMEDAAGYDEQLRRIQKRHRRRRDLKKAAEYLGSFGKDDKVHGVFTICLYYGKDPYDGPRELPQMIELGHLPEEVRGLINNYRIHVLEVRNFHDIDRFRSDLKEVFGFIQRAGDKDAEWVFTEENREKFEHLEEDAFDVITALTGSYELAGAKEQYLEEGGTVNMCEAIRGMIEDGRKEGIQEGIRKGIQKGELLKSRQVARNMFIRGATPEDAAGICEVDLETVKAWFKEWKRR